MPRTALIVTDMINSYEDVLTVYVNDNIAVPRDAVAHIHPHLAEAALELMELNTDADACDAEECEL